MTRRSVATTLAAVLGIVVSAALAWAASQLAGQRVGLSSEPLSVAAALSPRAHRTPAPAAPRHGDDHPRSAHRGPAGARTPTTRGSAAHSPPVTSSATTTTAIVQPSPSTVPTPVVTTTATATQAQPTGSARRPGHHGDGGDRHDD